MIGKSMVVEVGWGGGAGARFSSHFCHNHHNRHLRCLSMGGLAAVEGAVMGNGCFHANHCYRCLRLSPTGLGEPGADDWRQKWDCVVQNHSFPSLPPPLHMDDPVGDGSSVEKPPPPPLVPQEFGVPSHLEF